MKIKSWHIRFVIYTSLAIAMFLVVWPATGSIKCYGDGLSEEQRDRLFTAYFEALHVGKVERPLSYIEYRKYYPYRKSEYKPMIKVRSFGDSISVQIDLHTVVHYTVNRRYVEQGDGAYAFKEFKREKFDHPDEYGTPQK